MEKQEKSEINPLQYLAWKYSESDIPEQEIRQNNITDVFLKTIIEEIQRKNIINMHISGNVISGKSTVAQQICLILNSTLKKDMTMDMICPDQYFFLRKVMQNINNCCLVIDEFSKMSTSGANATIEDKLLEEFSDVQAQRHISRVACSPRGYTDKNVEYILHVLDKNLNKKQTRCLVYYKLNTPTSERTQLIGFADVKVAEVLEKDWYQKYRQRKEEKWKIMIENGIFHVRDLYYAKPILNAFKETEYLEKLGLNSKVTIGGAIITELEKEKLPQGIVLREYLKEDVLNLCDRRKAYTKVLAMVYKENIGPEEKEMAKIELQKANERLEKEIGKYIKRMEILCAYEAI